jgi:hypothetical protein
MLAPLIEADSYSVTDVRSLGFAGMTDVDLMSALQERGIKQILVTTDRAMRRRKHERAAVASTQAVVIVGVSNWNQQSSLWDRARMMLWWWPTIVQSSEAADPGTFLELPWRQKGLKPLTRWRA